MQDFSHTYKELCKRYNKALDKKRDDLLGYLVTYLKFVRDSRILSMPEKQSDDEKIGIAALVTAISEYESFKSCVNKYYKSDGEIVQDFKDKSAKEIKECYDKEKAYHWTAFWQLVMLNIEEWQAYA